jgi:hypothetical protein
MFPNSNQPDGSSTQQMKRLKEDKTTKKRQKDIFVSWSKMAE